MFHLPHNAVIPEEVEFILSMIDEHKEFYYYDELKAMMFEKEIREGYFPDFHTGMYNKYQQTPRLKRIYDGIKSGDLSYTDIKTESYTDNKNINGVWNEIVRDYFEFIAFTGLMPSYYKGRSRENEKRYYVGNTLKQYKNGEITYEDILYKMKHRNASKDFSSFSQQYDVRNRPFVVALKILDCFKNLGYRAIDGGSVLYYVRTLQDEDNLNNINVKPINKDDFSTTEYKEIMRGVTFMRQHLTRRLNVKEIGTSRRSPCVFDLTSFDINRYHFKDKTIFIGDIIETPTKNIELTPYILKCISNPSRIEDTELKNDLKAVGLINDTQSLCDFNIDTDLMSRDLVERFINSSLHYSERTTSTRVEVLPEYRRGKEISLGSDGIAYEEFLYNCLKNKFGERNVKWYGSHTSGQRVSDIVCDVTIKDVDGIDSQLKIIVESKAGASIRAFDERKEIDDIVRTLGIENATESSGIWYMVVDSDKLPSVNEHGGFRRSSNQKSFKDKLIQIHTSILSQIWKPTLVTAFSYEEFMRFLHQIDYSNKCITRVLVPDFWVWSDNFIQDSYVSIVA